MSKGLKALKKLPDKEYVNYFGSIAERDLSEYKAQVEKELKALCVLLKDCMFTLNKNEYSYWLESPLFNGNKLLLTKDKFDLLKEVLENA